TRLIATTRSRYAVDGAPPRSPRPSPRRSRRPDSPPGPPAPVPRRCVPGITYPSFRCHASEVQPAFAGRVRQRGDAAVVAVAAAVEDNGVDAGRFGALGDELADCRRPRLLVPRSRADAVVQRRRGDQRAARRVVDHLRSYVPGRTGDDEARAGGTAGNLLPHAEMAAAARRTAQHRGLRGAHLLACLSGLATDDLALVADALALVRLGLADLPDVGGGFADLLLVDPGDDETCRCLDREADALR